MNSLQEKKRKRKSRSFWSSYKQRASLFILSSAFVAASAFLLHRLYENYSNSASQKIVQKLASNKRDQAALNHIAQRIAEQYLLPQFNEPVPVDRNLLTGFKHVARPLSAPLAALSDLIYHPPRTAWNMLEGVAGAGTSNQFKSAYNHVIGELHGVLSGTSTKHRAETVQHKSFLYLNFQELFAGNGSGNGLLDLERNLRMSYGQSAAGGQWLDDVDLPESMDEFDVLRRALLIAIQTRFEDKSRKQQPIVLAIDSMDSLMFRDRDFKYWLMLLGGAVQQRMVSIVSVSSNCFGSKIVAETLQRTYGNIANPIVATGGGGGETVLETVEFLSREEVAEVVARNMSIEGDCPSVAVADAVYAVTKGYPLLTSAIVEGISAQRLTAQQVMDGGEALQSWFDGWYEGEYLVKCAVPQFKLMVSRMQKTEIASKGELKKLVKQIKNTLASGVDVEEKLMGMHRKLESSGSVNNELEQLISSETLELINDYMQRLAALEGVKIILMPDYVGGTLPLIKDYWNRHSSDHIANVVLANFDTDLTGSKLVGLS